MRFPSFKNKIVVFALIIAFIFLLNLFQKQVKGFFYSISSPIQSVLWQRGNALFHEQKNEQVKEENYLLRAKVLELEALQKEDEQLRQAFGLGIQKDFQITPAHIVGKDVFEDIITIDKGKNDGLKKDMPVITPGKVLAGKIIEVLNNVSQVMLVSNAKSSFDAAIPEKQINGLLKGKGKFFAMLDLVDKNKNLVQGDVVTTTRLSGMFPQNLLVGTVKDVKKNDLVSFQSATVVPFFDINATAILFVITQQVK